MFADDLSHVGLELIGFDDQSWRYIQVERYWLPRSGRVTAGVDALGLLMAHPRYQLNYQGQHRDGDPLMHGPYQFDHLSIDSYELVDEQTATEMITAFRDDDSDEDEDENPEPGEAGALGDDVQADIDFRVLRQIRKMPIHYRLRPQPDEAIAGPRYEGLGDYTELILVDLKAKELLLISAAWD